MGLYGFLLIFFRYTAVFMLKQTYYTCPFCRNLRSSSWTWFSNENRVRNILTPLWSDLIFRLQFFCTTIDTKTVQSKYVNRVASVVVDHRLLLQTLCDTVGETSGCSRLWVKKKDTFFTENQTMVSKVSRITLNLFLEYLWWTQASCVSVVSVYDQTHLFRLWLFWSWQTV